MTNQPAESSPKPRDFVADYTVERAQRPIVGDENKFKVAIFGANVSTGQGGLTHADNMIKLGNWDEIRGLAQKADRYGVDGFIPIARWKGLTGPENPWGRQFETLTWAAGLAEATENIQVFATTHVPYIHPLFAAKMITTIDHISNGRVGLNVVAGYHGPEYKAFGIELPEHDKRYEIAEEWMSIVEQLWSDAVDEFDFSGEYFNLEGAEAYPKPVQSPGPVVMSAGSSPAGQAFAFDHAQILFVAVPNMDHVAAGAAKLRANADGAGRPDLRLWAGTHIVCKDTEKEAKEYLDYLEEKADWEGMVRYLNISETGSQSMDYSAYKRDNADFKNDEAVRAHIRASLIPLTGTPEMIVDGMLKLSEAGIDGICTGMVDYDEGLDRLHEQIFPLMREAGLRA